MSEEKKIKLEDFQKENYIKEVPSEDLPEVASLFRHEILESVSKNGGHLSSNLGIVELTIALHRHFNLPKDKLIFDVGHQCYTHKLLTGRSLANLRQKNGVAGFQKRKESVFDPYEGGHASTSISAAYGMAVARDLDKQNYNIICVIGDSSLASGLAFEALNQIGTSDHKVIIIVNDNEMAISRPVGSLSRFLSSKKTINKENNNIKESYNAWYKKYDYDHPFRNISLFKTNNVFTNLGFTYFGPVSGHDYNKLEKILAKAEKCPKSCVIHVKTKKGLGYTYAEHDLDGRWHGTEPFDIATGKTKYFIRGKSWSQIMGTIVWNNMATNNQLVTITPAMTKGCSLDQVFETFPDRAFDIGIAEGHATVMASGLAVNGKHPVIVGYASFMQRGLDELNHDLCRLNVNCTILLDRSGLVGKDGETHQGIYDEGYIIATPNTVLTMPSTPSEANSLFTMSLEGRGVFIIKYPKDEIFPDYNIGEKKLRFGKWEVLNEASNTSKCLIACGPVLIKLAEEVKAQKINMTLINALFLKPLDTEMLKILLKYDEIYLYNPYSTRYGFINEVLSYLSENGFKGKVHIHCLPDAFIEHAEVEEQLKDNNVDVATIINAIKK